MIRRAPLGALAAPGMLVLLSVALAACALVAGIEPISIDSDGGSSGGPQEAGNGAGDGGGDGSAKDRDGPSDNDADTGFDASFDAGPPCAPTGPFGLPLPIAELSSTSDDWSARLTPDERVVYLASSRVGGKAQVYTASRGSRAATFGTPVVIDGANTAGDTLHPSFAIDQLTLVVQTGSSGSGMISVATRGKIGDAYSLATPITTINMGGGDNLNPFLTPDGTGLWFSSSREGGVQNVWAADRSGATFAAPAIVSLGPVTNDARSPVLSDDGLTIYFASLRGGATTNVYRAQRTTKTALWGNPSAVTEVNLEGASYTAPTWLSPDGCRLYLMSNPDPSGRKIDIYIASRNP